MYYIMEDKDGIERLFVSIYIDNIKTPYILSSNGSVYNIKSGFFLKWNKSRQSRYWDVRLKHPIKMKFVAYKVHRLVALYFVKNDDPEHKNEVNHKDGNKYNNSYTNLEWVTPSENCIHAVLNGLKPDVSLNEEKVRKICNLLELGIYTSKQIAEIVGCKKGMVDGIRTRNSWVYISKEYNLPKVRHFKKWDKYIDTIDELILSGFDFDNVCDILSMKKSKAFKELVRSRVQLLNESDLM